MNNPKLLVTSSTGNIGLPLSKALHEKGIPFTAATRNPDKAFEKFSDNTDAKYDWYIKRGGF